jgi:hypothetical protein
LRAELGREFCIQYLRERACAKSFPPFLCQAKLHVYDVADLCRYYGELYTKMTNNCASCSRRVAEQSLLVEQPAKPVPTAVAAEKPDAEKPDAEIPLRISCPHIQASPNPLCRRMQSCKESACEAAHSLSPAVRLPFCAAFLRSGGYCAAAAKCPRLHLNHMQLQTKYTMLLKQAVLACRSCAFNCKLFNPASKKHQLPQICNADFIGSCQRPTCQFVHMGEVKHLGLPPYCKTFAQTEACANRTAEKGIIHRTHAQYNATFKKCLAENERRCATCTRQLAGEMRDLDVAAANSTNLRERSPSPDIVFIGASPGMAVSASDKPAANSVAAGSVAKAVKRVAGGSRRSVEESPAKARKVGDISASAKPSVEQGGKARRDSGTGTHVQLLFI